MGKKKRITKRLLAFALSVAMIVTFTPTAMLSYAGENEAKAAVEEPATEATPAKDDVVKEEPAKEEATESKDDVVKEKEEEKVDDLAETKDIPVYADIRILKDPVHKTYNGEEQSVSYTASEFKSFYKVVYKVGDEEEDALPEGFNVDVVLRDINDKDKIVDPSDGVVFKGTDVGSYGVNVSAKISGSAEGYYIAKSLNKATPVEMVIDPLPVEVTVTGVTKEMTYDGVSHPLDLRFATISCDNELYDTGAVVEEIKPNSARDAGTYTTGNIKGLTNLDENFAVTFKTVTGTLTIKPAPLTVVTISERHIVNPESTEYFTAPKGWVEGLVGSDAKEWVEVVPDGQLPLWETGETDNTVGEINWNGVNEDNYELEYDLGTLTVFAEDEVQIIIRGHSNDKRIIYDGNVHSIDGYSIGWIDNPVFDKEVYDKYRDDLDELFEFTGTALVEAADAGHHPMGLSADQFSINPDNEEAQGYKVTFVVEDGYLDIAKKSLTVTIQTRHEVHDYTGKEISMRAFDWSVKESSGGAAAKGPSDAKDASDGAYKEDYFTFDGGNTITGTDVGIYSKTLKASQFHNNNNNFDVTFKVVRSKLDGDVIKTDDFNKKSEKAEKENEIIGEKEYTSTLEIVRPVITVELDGSQFVTDYDGKEHTLKVDAATNKVYFDGIKQEGNGFKVANVTNKTSFEFDPSKIYLRSDINLSGTDANNYVERDWTKRLSYSDPNVGVEFVSNSAMRLTIKPMSVKLVVEDFEMTFDGARDVFDYEDQLKAHYEGLPEGEEGPEYRVFLAGFVEEDLPDGVAEQHYLNAEFDPSDRNYDIEIVPGMFTVKKRPVTVEIKGAKKAVPAVKDGDKYLEQTVYLDYDISCSDEYYDTDFVEARNLTDDDPCATGDQPGRYYMGLDDPEKYEFENVEKDYGRYFDVTFDIQDGYIDIIDDETRYELEPIELADGTFVYDGESHSASLKSDEIHAINSDKTFRVEPTFFDYWSLDDDVSVDENGPVNAGEYGADIGDVKIYAGDVDVTAFCKWGVGYPATITITPRPITVKITGLKLKRLYTGNQINTSGHHSATIEVFDYGTNDSDTTGYYTKNLNLDYLRYAGDTRWPYARGTEPGKYPFNFKASDFANYNPNYEVEEFVIEDGYLEIVGNRITLNRPTAINTTFNYDGSRHPMNIDFNEKKQDGTFELEGDDGNTYTVKPTYPKIMFVSKGLVDAGVYTWYRTIFYNQVYDADGVLVTELLTERTVEIAGTVTITPANASINIKDNLSKTYGDPDPHISTWVTVTADNANVERLVMANGFVERVPGENVGKYEIRAGYIEAEAAIPIDPPPSEAAKAEAKKSKVADSVEKAREVAEVKGGGDEVRPGGDEWVVPVIEIERSIEVERQKNIDLKVDENKFFTINKAKLTITADDNEKDYGEKDPTLTATVGKGLVGSESLPKDFYSIYRDKGEDVKVRPKYYTIHVKAPNKDVDWDKETHYFKDEAEPVPFDPPPDQAAEAEEAADEYYQEAAAAEYYQAVDSYEYAAKAMKAAKALAAKKAEVEATEAKERIDFIEAIAEATEVSKEYPEEFAEAVPETAESASEEVKPEKPYINKPTEFNLLNYEVVTKNGKFNINGKNNGGDDTDDNDGNNPTPAPTPAGGDNNGNDGIVTADNTPTTVVENPAPTTTITDNAAPTSGNAFWALINLICMLLTALLSLIMLIRYFGKRREEDEETGEEREIKRKGLARLASLIPAIGAIIAFILTEDMSLPMIMVDKWTLMMVIILAIQVGVAILAKVKKEDAEEETA